MCFCRYFVNEYFLCFKDLINYKDFIKDKNSVKSHNFASGSG